MKQANVTLLLLSIFPAMSNATDLPSLLEAATPAIGKFADGLNSVPSERREVLDETAEFIAKQLSAGSEAQLTFICTHNSRRSHLSHIWAHVAADYYGLARVKTFSGGTEATECNIRTVRALRRAGLEVIASTEGENPKYLVQYADNRLPIEVYSKIYDSPGNPQSDYAAMMCCSDVDESCPVVNGAAARIPLYYIDPKASDDTPRETQVYDERCEQIGQEMFYVFAKAARLLGKK